MSEIARQFDSTAGEHYEDNPLTTSVRLIAEQRRHLGYATPELEAMILHEELTPALEVIVNQTQEAYGIVPLTFEVNGDDLIDPFGQSVSAVSEKGREWSRRQAAKGVPGAWKEFQRRTADVNNVATVAKMPPGSISLQVSANPIDWSPEERRAQNYTDLTMVSLHVKPLDNPDKVLGFHFVLPNLDTKEAILNLQDKVGMENDGTVDTQKMLANPKVIAYEGSALDAGREVDGLLGAVLLEKSAGHSTVRMIQRAIERRREAWRFITSEPQSDVHNEFKSHINRLSLESPENWEQGMAAIRTGLIRELKDRFLGRNEETVMGTVLESASARAVADGDSYLACNVETKATAISRAETVAALKANVVGKGSCTACGAAGSLYGCGLCSRCNNKWCDAYMGGKMLSIDQLADKSPDKSEVSKTPEKKSVQPDKETDWQRIVRQDEEQKAAARQRQEEEKLVQQKKYQQAA